MSRALVPGSALVVGLGRSGVAVAAMLSERGTNVAVTDDDGARLDAYMGAAAALDRDTATARLGDFDTVVVSPGVACTDPLLVAAAGAGLQVISEFALAARFVEVPLIAITGTNGKSTTVSLLARMLEEAGRTALAAGNIGRPLSSVAGLEADHIVAEVSSFQLEWPGDLSPDVVCLLNIGSDHLDRHRDLATYRRTKLDLFRGPRPPRLAVIAETAGDDIVSAERVRRVRRLCWPISTSAACVRPGAHQSNFPVPGRARPTTSIMPPPPLPSPLPSVFPNRRSPGAASVSSP